MNYDASFAEARTSDTCRDSVLYGFVQGAVWATYQDYVRVIRLTRGYSEATQLVYELNDEVPVSDSAAGKDGLVITHLDSVTL